MIVLASATFFSYLMIYEGIPQAVFAIIGNMDVSKSVLLLIIIGIILIFGLFMEASSIQYIIVPVFLPIVTSLGMHPIHFGVVVSTA